MGMTFGVYFLYSVFGVSKMSLYENVGLLSIRYVSFGSCIGCVACGTHLASLLLPPPPFVDA